MNTTRSSLYRAGRTISLFGTALLAVSTVLAQAPEPELPGGAPAFPEPGLPGDFGIGNDPAVNPPVELDFGGVNDLGLNPFSSGNDFESANQQQGESLRESAQAMSDQGLREARGTVRQEVFGSNSPDRYRLQQQVRDLGEYVRRQNAKTDPASVGDSSTTGAATNTDPWAPNGAAGMGDFTPMPPLDRSANSPLASPPYPQQ